MADRVITYSILESWLNNQSLQPPVETIRDAVELLKEQQPKTGHWIPKGYGYGRCSECGATVGNRYVSIYCHRCGSRNQQP